MSHHHDVGYKELFSYPEFVVALLDGFIPDEISQLLDYSTLKNESERYITPQFKERLEDTVWLSMAINFDPPLANKIDPPLLV